MLQRGLIRKHAVLLFVCLLWFSPGPGTLYAQSAASGSDALETVRVQLKWRHQFQSAGFYAAIDQGYYRDAGFEVELIEYSSSSTPIDQLIGGRVDFSVADSGALIYRSTGVPIVALAAFFQHSPSVLISLEDSGIRELEDLRGRRTMLAGGFMNAELLAMMATGIDNDDIELVLSDASMASLISGDVDAYHAYTTNEPFFLDAQGLPYTSFQPRDYGIDFYGDLLITTEARIEADPQGVHAFREATLAGWRYAVEHPMEIVDLILEQYNSQNKSRAHLAFEARESIELILPNVVPIGYMNLQRWQHIEEIFREQGDLINDVDLARFVYEPDPENSLLKVLGAYRLEIGLVLIVLAAGMMLLHIFGLRNRINARTHELLAEKLRAEREARTDSLTTLPNRRHFLEELRSHIDEAQREDAPLCLISIDVDFFKSINDDYGHAAGDEALREVAETLKRHTRASDIAARIGGEEFALACQNMSTWEAHKLAERLCREMANTSINYRDSSFTITLSIGLVQRESGDDVEQLLRKADLALYQAKQSGRNQIVEWRPDMTQMERRSGK